MEFVDTHCHLDDDAFAVDLAQVLENARSAGIRRFINIGYEPESWARTLELAERYPDIDYALGMHPNSADRWNVDTANELADLIERHGPVAIGETGLDDFREWVDRASQLAAFRDQLELGRRFGLPVVIHMRGDVEEKILSTLSSFPDVRIVFHSFDGSPELRDFAVANGHAIGVGGLMTKVASRALRETLRSVPLESIVLETDSPYLVPRGIKNRRNTPANIPPIARALAELLEIPVEQVAAQTSANARRVFTSAQFAAVGDPS
ncbi:MAG: TatD family hydrolase [Thermomicrobiales bacterium]|nr:TatD family hydrolase [Thermomicrobiales bacterium]